jgi:urease accessory protein
MRAVARIVAVAGRITTLYGEPPLVPRITGPGEVHFVGGAAAPLCGYDLRVEIEVGPGAELCVRTVAASLALPGDGFSGTRISARIAAGGRLTWLPEPLIAASGCAHEAVSTVSLAAGADLVWREELVCGRYGEEPGDARLRLAVRLDGRPLHRHDLAVGPDAPGWAGAAVLGGARAVGSVLLVGGPAAVVKPSAPAALVKPTATAALMRLERGGLLAVATGCDLREVRSALDPVVACATGGKHR